MFKLYYFDSAVAAAAEASGLKSTPKDLLNQHRNYQKIHNEKEHPSLSLKENQWKLRQHNYQNFLMVERLCKINRTVRKINLKKKDWKSPSQGSE